MSAGLCSVRITVDGTPAAPAGANFRFDAPLPTTLASGNARALDRSAEAATSGDHTIRVQARRFFTTGTTMPTRFVLSNWHLTVERAQ